MTSGLLPLLAVLLVGDEGVAATMRMCSPTRRNLWGLLGAPGGSRPRAAARRASCSRRA